MIKQGMQQFEFLTKVIALWPLWQQWNRALAKHWRAQTRQERLMYREEFVAARTALVNALVELGFLHDLLIRAAIAQEGDDCYNHIPGRNDLFDPDWKEGTLNGRG